MPQGHVNVKNTPLQKSNGVFLFLNIFEENISQPKAISLVVDEFHRFA